MPHGNWPCSGCGGTITELPFEPRSEQGLLCRECFKSKGRTSASGAHGAPATPRAGDGGNEVPLEAYEEGAPPAGGPAGGAGTGTHRQVFQGSWQCSVCGGEITQLPFEPRGTANLKCMDCFKKSRG
ncbi:hypothetical protein GVX82_00350 [Patescibacteria group bacterium]|jgi:CxxC-x17-CxxC domain-containing protein|nr:hypothetical protein [Patescibacteria group bacterium]